MAISFLLHGELDVLMDTVQVVKDICQLVSFVWPDEELVVHVNGTSRGASG